MKIVVVMAFEKTFSIGTKHFQAPPVTPCWFGASLFDRCIAFVRVQLPYERWWRPINYRISFKASGPVQSVTSQAKLTGRGVVLETEPDGELTSSQLTGTVPSEKRRFFKRLWNGRLGKSVYALDKGWQMIVSRSVCALVQIEHFNKLKASQVLELNVASTQSKRSCLLNVSGNSFYIRDTVRFCNSALKLRKA